MKVQSIDRVFDILEQLSREPEGMKLTEISQKLDLPTSTVYRLLSVLSDRNYAEKNDENNRYRLGLGLVELTSSFLSSLELKTEARPLLKQLSKVTEQVVFMGIEQEGEVVYIDRFERFNNHRSYCIIGSRMPMYCTALGKTLLMAFKDTEIRNLYAVKEMAPITEHTITDVDELISAIRINRSRGYSEDNEENTFGRYCVAAPVYDYRRNLIAAISTSWEINSAEDSNKDRCIELVLKTAREISVRMGWIDT
jgi:DNA-binding IclR family transcriptional regulator